MKTFFLFAFSFLFVGHALVAQFATQVINSNIRTQFLFHDFWTAANGDDDPNQDDPVVQLDLTLSPSGITSNEACVSWQCNAPCTYQPNLIYNFINIPYEERLDVLMLAYESDNNDVCTNYSDDDFYWIGNAVMANNGRITDSREVMWDMNNGEDLNPYLFPNAQHYDANLHIAWRYEAGETIGDPLQFGSLTPAQDIYYFGTNLPNPPGMVPDIELGWNDNGGNSSPDVFFSFSLEQASLVTISTDHDATDFDTYLVLYDSNGNEIDHDDDGGTLDGASLLDADLAPGNYLVKVEGYNDNVGQFLMSIEAQVYIPNDIPCNTIVIPADGTVQSGFSNEYASVDEFENSITPTIFNCVTSWCEPTNTIHNSLWFSFVAPASGAVEVSTCDMTDFDTQIAVYSVWGDCDNYGSYTLLAANDDAADPGCGLTSKMNVGGLTPGLIYYILVDGYNGTSGLFSVKVTPVMASAAHEVTAGSPLLNAYPNPTSGLLTVRLDDPLTMQACTLSDLTGKTVAELRWTNPVNQTELDLGALPAGVYFLQVHCGERVFSEKIMIQ